MDSNDATSSSDQDFASLPCETILVACKNENDLRRAKHFQHKNPMYQSAHVQLMAPPQTTSKTIAEEPDTFDGVKKEGKENCHLTFSI